MTLTIIGGIGLFLLGMVLLTDGLKAVAGTALRRGLARLTGGPVRALFAGIAATLLIQSSTATVLTTIGFVSAGLLTFSQAIGVIFGANVGTTSTGWMVSLLGLKLNVGAFALPVVGAGAFIRLLARGRAAAAGLALAGFGLIFVGIDVLQEGMAALSSAIDPGALPGDGVGGRLVLVLAGIVMTVITQSSSVAVAATLTALNAGTIDLSHGMALVVGQNVGTTATAAIAAIGAAAAAKRTAIAHIAFNLIAGAVAFALLSAGSALADLDQALRDIDPTIALAAFHTAFNLIGVLLLLPFTRRLARAIERMVPERGPAVTRHLDSSVQHVPAVAVEAARRATAEIAAALFDPELVPAPARAAASAEVTSADHALDQVRAFLAGVRTGAGEEVVHARHQSVLHAIDHLERYREALVEPEDPRARADPELVRITRQVAGALERARADVLNGSADVDWLEARSNEVAQARRNHRPDLLRRTAAGEVDPDDTLERLEAMRRIDRLLYHAWRAFAHLAAAADGKPVPLGSVPPS